jgi:putative phage-type endonuclease
MLTIENLEARQHGIGGSDASVILGQNKYKTIGELYLDKIGEGNLVEENEYMYWGNQLEDKIVAEFMLRNNKVVTTPVNTFRHPDHEWMIAHVDGVVAGESALLECKTCSEYRKKEWGPEGSDDIPVEYLLQCVHYAAVLNVDRVYIAVLIGGNTFKTFIYERNHKLESGLIEAERKFWVENVQKRIPPEDINSFDFGSYDNSNQIIVDSVVKSLFDEYRSAVGAKRDIEKCAGKLKNEIIERIGSAGKVIDEYGNEIGKVMAKSRTDFDSSRFKLKNPSVYSEYKKTSTWLEVRL